jgi:hypothetical protein
MTEQEAISETPKERKSNKRDIIRFNGGERPTAINLAHVTAMYQEGKRITLEFYTKAQFVDFADEEGAKSVFQGLVNTWAGDVLE